MQRYVYSVPQILIWAFALYIAVLAYQDFLLGGNSWKQGDWLINSMEATIRRGVMGSLLLRASQALSIDPVLLVVLLQISLLLATVSLIALSIRRSDTPATLWLLILSPGFFISFWSLDDQGGLRKELIAFLAFALLLFASSRPMPGRVMIYSSAIAFGFAVLSHEGNLFFAPFFAFGYYLLFAKSAISGRHLAALLVILAGSCIATVVIAFSFDTVTDYMTVCRPVLAAGVDAEICSGAIKALEIPLKEYLTATFWMFFSPLILSFALLYAITAIPIIVIGRHFIDGRVFIKAYIASAFLFLPLYVVAVDWGRWVSFHTTAVIFALLIALSLGYSKNTPGRELPPVLFNIILIFFLIVGFSHFVNVIWGGMAWKTINGVLQPTAG